MSLRLILAGIPGLLSLLLVLPEVPGVPRPALLANPAILLVAAAFAGSFAAPRCGLRLRAPGLASSDYALATAGGVLLGLAVAVLDGATRGLWQASGHPPSITEGWSPASLLVGLLYGGVVEEVTMRWGLMSLLVLLFWRLLARRAPAPPPAVLAAGACIAAVAFALGHLPALALGGAEMTGALVVRTVALNAAVGLALGWVYARRDLLSAMAAHGGVHLGFAGAALV